MSGYDSQVSYKPIDEPVKKNRSNQHFDKLSVGAGSQRFEVNVKDGLWMGADTFTDGKFSVDFSGGVIASSILIKNSNGDTLINSNASADYVNVINSKLNTNSQKLLKDFTFDGYTGAFKTGTITWNTTTGEITGGTGGIFFSDGLIFAKNGTPTIVLDGVTGDATFAGTLSGASGTFGTITAGTFTGGTFTGVTITGSLVRTESSGARIQMNNSTNKIEFLNSSAVVKGEFFISSNDIVMNSADDFIFQVNGVNKVGVFGGMFRPTTNLGYDLGTDSYYFNWGYIYNMKANTYTVNSASPNTGITQNLEYKNHSGTNKVAVIKGGIIVDIYTA